MRDDERRYRDALAQIAEVARAAIDSDEDGLAGDNGEYDATAWGEASHDDGTDHDAHGHGSGRAHGCTIRHLPRELLVEAARRAVRINPVNALAAGPVGEVARAMGSTRLSIAVRTAKYWGPQPRTLTVSFLESTPADLRRRIVQHMNAWSERCGIRFAETSGMGHVRITRGSGGYWSYLGTDITLISENEPTLGLSGFTMNTRESEFRRVVRHEAGHTLGFPHEHMRRELVADRPHPRVRLLLAHGAVGPQGSGPAGPDAAGRVLDHRHAAGPGLHHVLPTARRDHPRRAAHPRRR